MPKKVNIELLRESIKSLRRGSRLYKTLKAELSALGYWKNRARGKPSAVNFKGKGAV